MFGFLTSAVENAFDVADEFFSGEINKRKVAKLVSDGVSVAVIATTFGVGVEVVRGMLEEN